MNDSFFAIWGGGSLHVEARFCSVPSVVVLSKYRTALCILHVWLLSLSLKPTIKRVVRDSDCVALRFKLDAVISFCQILFYVTTLDCGFCRKFFGLSFEVYLGCYQNVAAYYGRPIHQLDLCCEVWLATAPHGAHLPAARNQYFINLL